MSKTPDPNAVALVKPLTIDGAKVTHITLRKPQPGELRGLKLTDVLQMDVNALTALFPRISTPALTPDQCAMELDTADFGLMAQKVVSFFAHPSITGKL